MSYCPSCAELERKLASLGCLLAGPGRGDCAHFVGLPGRLDELTTDVYGKPHGWCWSCWKDHKLEKAEAQLATALQLTTRASIEHLQSSYQASACFKHRCGLAIPK